MGLLGKKEEKKTGFNSRFINVVVEKQINSNLYQEVGEFIAEQDKTDSKSLVIQNQDMEFVEELDFTENELITSLKTALEFKNKSKDEKLAQLNKSIEFQSDKLKSIKDGYWYKPKEEQQRDKNGNAVLGKDGKPKMIVTGAEKVQVNIIDERVKLRLLECLKQHIVNYDDRGAYEIININGMREIRFLVVDDLLYPLYRSPNNKTIYPNMVTKKKIYKIEMDLARKEYEEAINSKIWSFFDKMKPILTILLLIIGIFWSVSLGIRESNFQDDVNKAVAPYKRALEQADLRCTEASTKCSFYLAEFTQNNVDLIRYANDQLNMLSLAMNQSIQRNQQLMNPHQQVVERVIDEVSG